MSGRGSPYSSDSSGSNDELANAFGGMQLRANPTASPMQRVSPVARARPKTALAKSARPKPKNPSTFTNRRFAVARTKPPAKPKPVKQGKVQAKPKPKPTKRTGGKKSPPQKKKK